MRLAAGLITLAGLVPFGLAVSAYMQFQGHRRIAAFLALQPDPAPTGLVIYIDVLCVVGALWLATAMTGWAAYLTRRRV
jgi:hypothetical protein